MTEAPKTAGSFQDFEALFEQLDAPALMQLGQPLPSKRHLPRPRAGRCPATHNRALFGSAAD